MTAPVATAGDARRHTHRSTAPSASPLTGLGGLLRLYGRLSRRAILIWTLAMGVLVHASVVAIEGAYPTQAALDARAQLLDNPSAVMMTGPFFATDQYTAWAMVANELFLYVLIPVAIMSVLLIVRHTRAEEESGRLEQIRALPTGRLAPPLAALLVTVIANLLVGAAVTVGLLAAGGAGADSLALGAATVMTGMVFAAAAMVTAQVTEHAGTASGLGLGLLVLAVLVRGVGDVIDRQGSWLSWFSPIAWAQQTRVYVDLRWWPLLVSLAAVLALLVLAGVLARRRDVGAGLLAATGGRGAATGALLAPGGLSRRLLMPSLVAWGIGLFLFAVAFGALASSLDDFVEEIPAISEWAPIQMENLVGSFAAFVLRMLAIGPIALIVSAVLRLRGEELAGRLGPLLLRGSSRTVTASAWFLVALVQVAVVQVLLGLGVGLGVAQATDDATWIGELTLAALAYLPAIALYGAVALFLYGLSLRSTGLAWLLVIVTALIVFLGDLLGIGDGVRNLIPLEHVSMLPSEDLEVAPQLVMGAAAVVLVVLGLLALRRRDLAAG